MNQWYNIGVLKIKGTIMNNRNKEFTVLHNDSEYRVCHKADQGNGGGRGDTGWYAYSKDGYSNTRSYELEDVISWVVKQS